MGREREERGRRSCCKNQGEPSTAPDGESLSGLRWARRRDPAPGCGEAALEGTRGTAVRGGPQPPHPTVCTARSPRTRLSAPPGDSRTHPQPPQPPHPAAGPARRSRTHPQPPHPPAAPLGTRSRGGFWSAAARCRALSRLPALRGRCQPSPWSGGPYGRVFRAVSSGSGAETGRTRRSRRTSARPRVPRPRRPPASAARGTVCGRWKGSFIRQPGAACAPLSGVRQPWGTSAAQRVRRREVQSPSLLPSPSSRSRGRPAPVRTRTPLGPLGRRFGAYVDNLLRIQCCV